jgi:hypothetical protein
MLGVAPYARSTAAPRVLETDFENLTSLNLTDRQTRHHLPFSPWTTTCEQALQPLIQLLQTHEAVESTNQEPQIH